MAGKTYVISDVEGRCDLYLNFLLSIGAIDKNKLNNEALKILRGPVQNNDNDQYWHLINYIASNLDKYLDPDFDDTIVINGDLISDRPWIKLGIYLKSVIPACRKIFTGLKNMYRDRLVLIAGNHDIYHELNNDRNAQFDRCLLWDKQYIVKRLGLKRYHKIETDNGDTFFIKHSPWASSELANEMLNNQNNAWISSIKDWSKMSEGQDDKFYSGYINTPGNSLTPDNLRNNRCFLIHGHTHEANVEDSNSIDISRNKVLAKKEGRICTDMNVFDFVKAPEALNFLEIDDHSGKIKMKNCYTGKEIFTYDCFKKHSAESSIKDNKKQAAAVKDVDFNHVDQIKEIEFGPASKTIDEKENKVNSQEKEKRPEVKWWMIALCFLLIGIIFILNTLQRQQEYDEKHKNITNSSDNDLDTDKGQAPDQQTPNK